MTTHGTRSCYIQGCRRPECRAANAKYRADARERAKNGDTVDRRTLTDSVDATPAREHLTALKESGFSMSSVAKALEGDVSYHTILKIHRGQAARISPETERLVLAVGVES